jgi:hypothetical protein
MNFTKLLAGKVVKKWRHKVGTKQAQISCASFVLVLCQSVLIICFFCAWHRIGTNRNDQILCLVCADFVRSLCVVCASLCHLFFTSVCKCFRRVLILFHLRSASTWISCGEDWLKMVSAIKCLVDFRYFGGYRNSLPWRVCFLYWWFSLQWCIIITKVVGFLGRCVVFSILAPLLCCKTTLIKKLTTMIKPKKLTVHVNVKGIMWLSSADYEMVQLSNV